MLTTSTGVVSVSSAIVVQIESATSLAPRHAEAGQCSSILDSGDCILWTLRLVTRR